MNKADKIFRYGIKEVPDVFICNEKGDILYYSDTLKKVSFIPKEDNLWECKIIGTIGNLDDWYNIPFDSSVHSFYFRTFKRNVEIGEDEPLCFAITPKKIIPQSFTFEADSESFNFPIVFNFKTIDLLWVKNEDCPKYYIDLEPYDSAPYVNKKTVKFTRPVKNYKQVKIEQVKKRLKELKDASKRNSG